jgi:hypothetical protein
MASSRSSWLAPAAYLYVLGLDSSSLAWEYLRRNPTYQALWRNAASRANRSAAGRWSLEDWEDPRRDARTAEPAWSPLPRVSLARYNDIEAAPPFQFWGISGRKSLIHDGHALRLSVRQRWGLLRATLESTLTVAEPYGYLVPAGRKLDDCCRAVREFEAIYQISNPDTPQRVKRPGRLSLMHMRILQALDGAEKGASHRDIASALFGEAVLQAQWSRDGELRAQIRHWLRRGAQLSGGGYRTLLDTHSR